MLGRLISPVVIGSHYELRIKDSVVLALSGMAHAELGILAANFRKWDCSKEL